MIRIKWLRLLACMVFLTFGAPIMADETPERLALAEAAADAPRMAFNLADAPDLTASTFSPPDFVWDDVDDVPPTFMEAGVFSSFRQRYVGYDPANRDRYEVSIFTANLEPDRVAPAAGIASLLAARWGPLNFGIKAHDITFGEVAGGDESSGEMIVSRISVWRRGLQVLILRQRFEAAHFDTYGDTIAKVAGSLRFATPDLTDPILDTARTGKIDVGDAEFAFRLLPNWTRLVADADETPMAAEIWHDGADPNGNAAVMVMAAPATSRPVPGERPNPVPEQQMFDFAGTVANILIENLMPDATLELAPRDMNSFASLDGITAFNRYFVIDGRVNGKTPVVIGVTIVMPADGTTLVSASLSPGALDLYLFGTQRHVDLANALLLVDMETYSVAAAKRQGWIE